MKLISRSIWLLVIAFFVVSVDAQEKQVPFFPEQEIVTIEKNYAKRMTLFQEYNEFVEAKLFLKADSTYAVEIFYKENAFLYKERKEFSEIEKDLYLKSMLQPVNTEVGADSSSGIPSRIILNQNGRPSMLVMNTLAGLGYYGWALPTSFGIEEEKAFVSLYMLAASASFYIPYKLTENLNVSLAQASLTFYGQSRGGLHGYLFGSALMNDVKYDDYVSSGELYDPMDYDRYQEAKQRKNQALFGLSIAGSVVEGIAGYKLAKKWDYSGGSTSIFQMWGDVGTISGLLLSETFGFWDNEEDNAAHGTTLLTSFVGMTAGKFFGDSKNYVLGDAIVYRSTILLSCFLPVTLVNYFQPDEFTAYAYAGLAGIAAGSYFGWKATLNRDFSTSEGVFVALGELAGGLLGAGLGYLIAPEDNDGELILTTTTIGAFGGYALMYGPFSKKVSIKNDDIELDVSLNPMSLIMKDVQPVGPAYTSLQSFVSVRMRF